MFHLVTWGKEILLKQYLFWSKSISFFFDSTNFNIAVAVKYFLRCDMQRSVAIYGRFFSL
jgi:hypothetical protein